MKGIVIKTELPYNYRKLKGFFISPGDSRPLNPRKVKESSRELIYV
jgi:hypothetical protein